MSKLDQYLSNGIKNNVLLSKNYVFMANQNMSMHARNHLISRVNSRVIECFLVYEYTYFDWP